jgi:hypothetical protein
MGGGFALRTSNKNGKISELLLGDFPANHGSPDGLMIVDGLSDFPIC